ncbi:response regulator (plasmid) [Comamonadaceae bacterium OTU4NAUVB1]|nr:response regulator [Comamonadaceae bacterium OTU4NAUVB1]
MLKVARCFAVLALMSAFLTLTGYGNQIHALTGMYPQLQGMSVSTAAFLVFLSISVLTATTSWARLRTWTAGLTLTGGVSILLSHLVAGRDAISPAVAQFVFGMPAAQAGRTAIATAVACSLVALSLLMQRPNRLWADAGAGLALVIAATGLLGRVYGVTGLYEVWLFNTMAPHTAASLVLLALAVLMCSPAQGWSGVIASASPGGAATRRQLLMLLVPVVAGWLLLQGVLNDKLSVQTAIALIVVVTVWPLALLILRDGRTLLKLEQVRGHQADLQSHHRQEMERKLSVQAKALEQANSDRLRTEVTLQNAHKMETIGQLTGGIAHDFNNLLMAISGNLQLLRRRLPKDMVEHRYVDNAMTATSKGAKVTSQLLAFSRTQRLTMEATDIQAVLTSAHTLIGNALGPGISLTLQGTPGLWARTDPDQLELALLNLAVNARDAMPDGGSIEIDSCESADGRSVDVWLTDTGTGMSPEVLARATEPFFTTKERGKGTGLGLAQVHGFVQQCEGHLVIQSQPGQGTTVLISLPRVEPLVTAEDHAARQDEMQEGLVLARLYALVVDDDAAVREIIVAGLEHLGFDVQAAVDGQAGLASIQARQPDVMVIDFLMPGMNGAVLGKAAQAQYPALPIVFVSGYSDTLALNGIANAVVLRKPFRIEDLHRAVRAVLDHDEQAMSTFGELT